MAKRISDRLSFKKRCEDAAEKLKLDIMFCEGDHRPEDDAYEDDLTLHVRKYGLRACFGVGGDNVSGGQQNANTIAVLRFLYMAYAIGERVLVDEVDGEEEDQHECNCPHCERNR